MMSNFCFNYLTHILYRIVFGVTSSCAYLMMPLILIDIIGLKTFIQGYGIQMFFMGIGNAIGPPIVGNSLILSPLIM